MVVQKLSKLIRGNLSLVMVIKIIKFNLTYDPKKAHQFENILFDIFCFDYLELAKFWMNIHSPQSAKWYFD